MIPIFLHKKGDKSGLTYAHFEQAVIGICRQHQVENRALVFALLLYDFSSPGVWTVLDDKHFWFALDKVAGDKVSVFSIHTPPWLFGSERPGRLQNIRESDPGERALGIIKQYFPISDQVSLPSIVFFQVDGRDVIDAYLVKIHSERVEDAFQEMRAIIERAADSVRNVLPENRRNAQEIFNLVVGGLQDFQAWRLIRIVGRKVLTAGGLVRLFGS